MNLIQSFYSVFYFMILAFIITVIAFTQVETPIQQLILSIEMCITGISSYMYYLFIQRINSLHTISVLRYNGWVITTPLMLIALCLLLHIPTTIHSLSYLIGLDWIMLLAGYLGERNWMPRILATVAGFVPFLLLFYTLYSDAIFTTFTHFLFWIYFTGWACYGLAYLCNEPTKHVFMNLLDCFAKAFVAIAISVYFVQK
jgi:hypothetical protein